MKALASFVLMSGLAAAAASAPLEFRQSPVIDMHHWVRSLLQEKSPPSLAELPAALAAARALEAELGGGSSWGIVEGGWSGAASAADLRAISERLPAEAKLRDGRAVKLREPALALADAYTRLEPMFLAQVWPAHRERVAAVKDEITRRLGEQERLLADLCTSLGAPALGGQVPVYLTAAGPWPGAVTHRSRAGAMIVLASDAASGTQLVEAVLHEATHAIDLAAGESSVLAELRRKLDAVPGASPKDIHDIVHTVMFAQAAGTVRKLVDPGHRDYGEVAGYYAKVPRAAAAVLPAWRDHLAGAVSRDEAVARIVAAFAAGSPQSTPRPSAAPGHGRRKWSR